jgi:hypothetical protein
MSERNPSSLLKGLKRSLPALGQAVSEDAESRILPNAPSELQTRSTQELRPVIPPEGPQLLPHTALQASHLEIPPDNSQNDSHDINQVISPVVSQSAPQYVLQGTQLKPKKKKFTVTFSLRIEVKLLERLRSVADYNELDMTSIINEALERHLLNFPQPPPNYKRRR